MSTSPFYDAFAHLFCPTPGVFIPLAVQRAIPGAYAADLTPLVQCLS